MTLAQRVKMLHRRFPQMHITEQWLGQIYKKHRITRKAVRTKKFTSPDKDEEIKDLIEFCHDEL